MLCHTVYMKDRFRRFNSGRAVFFLVGFIAVVLAATVMKLTAPVLLPFIIAILLSFVMEPMVSGLQRFKIPRVFAILMVIMLISAGLYLIGVILFNSASTILTLYPKYESRFSEIYAYIATFFGLPYNEHQSIFMNLWSQLGVRNLVRDLTLSLSNSFIGFLRDAVMVIIFIVFFMSESSHIIEKIELAFEDKAPGKVKRIAQDVVRQVSRYLSIKFLVSVGTAIFVTVGLSIVGMDFPVVWGVLSFILNFIPNIGSIVAGVGVGVFSLVQFWPQPEPIVGALIVVLSTNMLIGNVIEPKVQGDNLGLSPFVVVVSLLAWGWLWGFAGLILAVPMTVIVKIFCENIPVLEPVSLILGSYRAALNRRQEEDETHDSDSSPYSGTADQESGNKIVETDQPGVAKSLDGSGTETAVPASGTVDELNRSRRKK